MERGYFISNAETPAGTAAVFPRLEEERRCRLGVPAPGRDRASTLHRLHARRKDAWATNETLIRYLFPAYDNREFGLRFCLPFSVYPRARANR